MDEHTGREYNDSYFLFDSADSAPQNMRSFGPAMGLVDAMREGRYDRLGASV